MSAAAIFEETRERLVPLLLRYRFRPAGVEHEDPHAFAEFWRNGLRLRLVWEGREQALWIEVAPDVGGQVVGAWRDIEWLTAGERLPLDRDTSLARTDRLLAAVQQFLVDRPRAPSARKREM